MIRTDTPPEEITDEHAQAVIAAVRDYMKAHGIKQSQLARGLVLATSTVSQILSGNYQADARPIIAAMDRWLERRKASDEQPAISKFVWTSVAREVRLAAQRAMAAADQGIDAKISLVWGHPGCGKTLALQAVAECEDGILITCGADVKSSRGILEAIARELRIPLGREAFSAVINKLRGSGKLIIVDEIHALLDARNDNAFHDLRRLSDQAGVPQLWASTCDLIAELRYRESRREPLGQIIRRIGCQFNITRRIDAENTGPGGRGDPLYTIEEILAIYGANELKLTREAARFLARLCTSAKLGLFGSCTNLIAHATVMNRGKPAAAGGLTPAMLWEAGQFLFHGDTLRQVGGHLREEIKEIKELKLKTA